MPVPETVLDLGANIGLTAAHYQHLWPGARIVAVEMDAGNADLARRNAPGVTVREEAVAAEKGVSFYDDEAEEWAYALGTTRQGSEGRTVMRRTLRSIVLREFGKGGADFVKMDVEGEEWDLFKQAAEWGPLVRHLLVELHGPLPVGHAVRLLEAGGYLASPHVAHPAAVFAWWR